ncbi:TonB-dependent receptor [Chryseobacterium carnipullorum]|uniref:Colicin I receptor n=1 Tax=Chryseobacterium carnipullorum TaxID=1124835 RepID=A0A376EVJ5_CHRCU|nr:TonB-dependent receptor [Chryseobacterium carnipullorum]AZA51299.1 TonB-dependent receptor [Chryseobacterium carnipullorum]AZA67892.1 TonB-dependent receptor [Chryseobacterium carnipullorum]STD14157.1 Colicin I receptor precursor [Chryseobacterium carnipullorum]
MRNFEKKTIIASAALISAFYFGQSDSATSKKIDDVVILGSRGAGRSLTDTPVPVDIINISKILRQSPVNNISQALNYVVPSFSSTSHTVNDGTDFVDPALLRGLGPDQVLVLLNGKRRYQSSLINVTLTPGRGSVGTDLNAIPAFALEKIEVLRDGASAQYGSDAIAGVVNLGLKKRLGLSGQVFLGGYASPVANNFSGGVDGQTISADLNYGAKIGEKGFINVTGSVQYRDPYSRAGVRHGDIYNAYNAINYRALQDGVNIDGLYKNITNTSNSQQIINTVKQYASQVGYFSQDFRDQISGANSIAALQGLLGKDFTNDELSYRGLERKDFSLRAGQSKLQSGQLYFNSEIPVNEDWKVYSFGGYSYRLGNAGGFFRLPNTERNINAVTPNGYLPQIEANVNDYSLAGGIKGKWNGWNVDLSNTFGKNAFNFGVVNTFNASLGDHSPRTFKAGGSEFLQNTLNLDFSKKYDVLQGLNVAFGGEYRYENYKVNAGNENSYVSYDIFGRVVTAATPENEKVTDFFGHIRPAGSQVFPGFSPDNAVSGSRNSVAAYADVEIEPTDWWLVEGAVRYENYSDFGSTFNYKLATNVKLAKNFNVRGAVSTGFRAPSLAQIYYSSTSTLIQQGKTTQVGTFRNNSEAAQALGIPKLKQETSQSYSTGITWKIPALSLVLTADAYLIKIKDRVVLTDLFYRPEGSFAPGSDQAVLQGAFDLARASAANFFANAVDSQTKGLDITISQNTRISEGISLENNLGLNLNQTRRVGEIHASPKLVSQIDNYFSEPNRVYFEEAVPRIKATLANTVKFSALTVSLRNSYFGKVTDADVLDTNFDGVTESREHFILNDRIVTDLSVGYDFNKNISATIGSNNIFNRLPSRSPDISSLTADNQFVYSRQVSQYGIGGRFVFARVEFKF